LAAINGRYPKNKGSIRRTALLGYFSEEIRCLIMRHAAKTPGFDSTPGSFLQKAQLRI
jgi:hypothetical protein